MVTRTVNVKSRGPVAALWEPIAVTVLGVLFGIIVLMGLLFWTLQSDDTETAMPAQPSILQPAPQQPIPQA
ncbi:MAG TPA: hypothetical protein VF179_19485 [Thermoanaerobaculia bacterium]|nr:hypothetical protein [Thermoanaerobaculia bacterium]